MSKQEQNLNLWQQKRAGLNIETDVQSDWMDMHQLLDKQMPLTGSPQQGPNVGSNATAVKHLTHLAKFKLFYIIAATVTTAATTYLVVKNKVLPTSNPPAKVAKLHDSLLVTGSNTVNPPGFDTTKEVGQSEKTEEISANNQGQLQAASEILNRNTKAGVSSATEKNNADRASSSSNNTNINLAAAAGKANKLAGRNAGINNSANLEKSATQFNFGNVNNIIENMWQKAVNPDKLLWLGSSANRQSLISGNTADLTSLNKAYKTPGLLSSKKIKSAKNANTTSAPGLGIEWGVFMGLSLPDSFTPKAQNSNFYGSLPIDVYTGAFVTANINTKWAVDAQVKLLIPNKANEQYDHVYTVKNDSAGGVKSTLKINETRKIYSAQIPVHLVYNINEQIGIKAGPVINIPLKYYRLSSITPTTPFIDSVGYIGKLMDTLNTVKYENKLSFGVSSGVSYTYKRLRLEATYYYSPQRIKVVSPLSNYSKSSSNMQISIGFKLNKPKP